MILAITIATIGALGTGGLIGVVLTHKRESSSGLITALSARLNEVEADLNEQREWRRAHEHRYHRLWLHCRALIDYAYRHRKADSPPIPDMPEDLT